MGRLVSLTLIFLLSFSTITLFDLNCSITAASNLFSYLLKPETLATEHGYIRANGTVEPSSLPIKSNGNVYQLTDNIQNYTLEIQCDNVVVDGNNFSLSIPAYGEVDSNGLTKVPNAIVSIFNRTNVLVQNLNFTKYSYGIEIINSTNIVILQNTLQNGNNGIYMQDSTNCTIMANQITNNPLHGLFIRDCSSFNLSYNTISKCLDGGILVDRVFLPVDIPHSAIFTRNTLSENNYAIFFRGQHTNNFIFENNFLNQSCGVAFIGVNCTNNLVYNNYWENNSAQIINYTTSEQDPSPLTNEISTVFDKSLFTQPVDAQSALPTLASQSIPTLTNAPLPVYIPILGVIVIVLAVLSLLVYRRKLTHNPARD